jgi:predicted house-cleaning noncanonical NTP pyrophosphatase (MazG superfamily)
MKGKKTVKYDKLIRDKIPEIIIKSGKIPVVEDICPDDIERYLDMKLQEEVREYQSSGDVSELADIIEVVYEMIRTKNLTIEEFEKIREEKLFKRGGFEKHIKLIEVIEDEADGC